MFDAANVGGDTMVETLSTLFRLPPDGMPMTIMQLAGFPAEVVDSVVSVLLRMAFEFGLWSDGAFPLLCVCEEAHRYAPADRSIGFGPTRKAVSRIAKEGRKYGVFLGLITQRPAELDATIISQCSTLFAMRMANDRDQAIVRSAVSDAAGSLDRLRAFIGHARGVRVWARRGAPHPAALQGTGPAPHSAFAGGDARQHGLGEGRRRRVLGVGGRALARRHHGRPDAGCAQAVRRSTAPTISPISTIWPVRNSAAFKGDAPASRRPRLCPCALDPAQRDHPESFFSRSRTRSRGCADSA